jgi:thiol-disulfide isomerase/thioredoxin
MMNKFSRHRILFVGLLSPVAAVVFGKLVYQTLTWRSADPENDWFFRLLCSGLAMTLPFLFTLFLAVKDRQRGALSRSASVGLALAILSLGLAARPMRSGIRRSAQSRNEAMRDIAAPSFDTVDIFGNPQRLVDQKNKVVLVSIWASWCEPCRAEMPKLDELYRGRKDQGLVVFGISNEDVALQRRFVQIVPVTYPLLTLSGEVPAFYRDIVRYPAIFLIDRQGRLQPAPGPDQPFEKLQAAVDLLLNRRS